MCVCVSRARWWMIILGKETTDSSAFFPRWVYEGSVHEDTIQHAEGKETAPNR